MKIDCYFNFQCLGTSVTAKVQSNLEVYMFRELFTKDELAIKLFVKDLGRSMKVLLDMSTRLPHMDAAEKVCRFLLR